MPRKSNKKITGVKAITDPAAQRKIEADYERARLKIEAQMNHLKRFEELVSMKITAEHCPGCKAFLSCPNMRHGQRFNKNWCYPNGITNLKDIDHGEKLFAQFAKGLTLVEDLKPAAETFSGN
ncbi:MAG TPA: hypothetical protein VGQ51_13205 [Puia sp.]|jgi:hypothetical protein|nr:hypothetical protein [Puia sp.]